MKSDFLENLINAFKKCNKERVLYSQLADKYRELYPAGGYDELVRKCSPTNRIKGFLELHKETFHLDEGLVALLSPCKNTVALNSDSTSSSVNYDLVASVSNDNLTSPSLESVIVLFQYGEKKFPPKKILCDSIEDFRINVHKAWSVKLPNFESVHLEYQCCGGWYLLEEVDSFEDLLIDEKTKVHVRGVPKEPRSINTSTGMLDVASSTTEYHHDKHEATSDTSDTNNIETSDDIDKMEELKGVIMVSIDYLRRSLVILIKSVFTRLYGTADTLKELLMLTEQINAEKCKIQTSASQVTKKIESLSKEIAKIVDKKCCFWEASQAPEKTTKNPKDWIYYLVQILRRLDQKVPNENLDEFTESNLSSQPADRLLKVLTRAAHKGEYIFSSSYINFTDPTLCCWDFRKLSEAVLTVRNFYFHGRTYKDAAPRFQRDFSEVEKLSQEIVRRVEKEDCFERNITIVRDDLQHIKLRYNGHQVETSVNVNEVLKSLLNFSFNQFGCFIFSP